MSGRKGSKKASDKPRPDVVMACDQIATIMAKSVYIDASQTKFKFKRGKEVIQVERKTQKAGGLVDVSIVLDETIHTQKALTAAAVRSFVLETFDKNASEVEDGGHADASAAETPNHTGEEEDEEGEEEDDGEGEGEEDGAENESLLRQLQSRMDVAEQEVEKQWHAEQFSRLVEANPTAEMVDVSYAMLQVSRDAAAQQELERRKRTRVSEFRDAHDELDRAIKVARALVEEGPAEYEEAVAHPNTATPVE